MIKKLFFSTVVTFFAIYAQAQTINVQETTFELNKTNRPALVVNIPLADQSSVEKAWKSEMKSYKYKSYSSKRGLMSADNVTVKTFSIDPVDIYASSEKEDNEVLLYVVVDMGTSYLNSSDSTKVESMKEILKKFAVSMTLKLYNDKINAQQDLIKKTGNQIDKNTSAVKIYEKQIKSYEDKIKQNKDKIIDANSAITKDKTELEKEKDILFQLKNEASRIE